MMSSNNLSPTVLGDAVPSKEIIEAVRLIVKTYYLGRKITKQLEIAVYICS